jgi:hypothetical protein
MKHNQTLDRVVVVDDSFTHRTPSTTELTRQLYESKCNLQTRIIPITNTIMTT